MGLHKKVPGINEKEWIMAGFCKLILKEIDTKNNSCGTFYFIPSSNYYYYSGSPILVTPHYFHFKRKPSLKLSSSALSGSLEGSKEDSSKVRICIMIFSKKIFRVFEVKFIYISTSLHQVNKKAIFPLKILTWQAAMPTKQLRILSKIQGSSDVIMLNRSTPWGLSACWQFSMAAANMGMFRRAFPMPGHCEPIPVNTNQTGRLHPG